MATENKEEKGLEAEFDDFDQESSGGALFKFDTVGTKLTGLIVAKKEGKTKTGPATFYTVQTNDSEHTFIPTKALKDDLEKFLRMYGGVSKVIVSIEFTGEKAGAFASPFKIFKVRAGAASEQRLAALGISTFDGESTSEEDGAPL